MKLFNHLLYALLATSLWAGCTSETEEGGGNAPLPDDGGNASARQEVVLTLDNKLVLGNGNTTRAGSDGIATEAENAIDALDVFVFGSQSENGTYSYLERFAYRSDKSRMPAGATELELVTNGDNGDKVNAVLGVKKGFFVRLYCVANQETLIDPADPDGAAFEATDYVPMNYTVADDGSVTVLAEGAPTEDAFKTFHTPLINPADKDDVLLPALPMSGGLITPLDLRDHKAAGRLTAGFRLTRSVARFDVRNNPELTRLTVDSVAMVRGRKAVTLFPIQVYGDRPTAAATDLVTYPARPFTDKDSINISYQKGAFYSYPCLAGDEASLLIKGKYQINQTESKEVVYTVPFQQALGSDQTSTAWIEIQTNHRYTVSILDADEYNLQFNLSVADWNDEGSIDDYEPDNTLGDLAVNIPDAAAALVTYDADTKTVSMGREAENTFSIVLKTNSALQVTTSYQGNVKDCNWVAISEPVVKPTVVNDKYTNEYTYTVTPNADYAGNRFPRATFRFMDLATGDEQILFVKLTGTPVLNEMTEAEWPAAIPEASKINEFDVETQTASLFLIDNSQVPFTVTCSDEVEVEGTLPEYLELTQLSKEGDEAVYALKLKTTEVADIPADGVTVTLVNKNMPTRKQTITVKLLDASVEPTFASLGGTNVEHTPGSGATPDNVTVPFVADNAFTVSTMSVEGVDVNIDYNSGSHWLTSSVVPSTRAVAKDHKTDIKFSLVEDALPGAKPVTVTLTNKVKGGDYAFTVTPKADKPVLTKADTPSVPVDDVVAADGSITMYKLPSTSSTLAVKVAYLGGSKLSCDDADLVSIDKAAVTSSNEGVYTLTALKTGSSTLTVTSAIDDTQTTKFNIQVLSPAITTDATDNALSLSAVANTTATVKVSSLKGYTASVTDWGKDGVTNGQAWFDITSGSTGNGGATAESLVIKVKANIASLYPIKPATITLTNKIANGGNTTVTVNPTFVAPTVAVVANTATPTQNTFDATNKTLKLYKVKGSQIQIKGSSIGNNILLGTPKNSISVTSSQVAGSVADVTYTVTLPDNISVGDIADAIVLANKSDNTQQTKLKVSVLDPAISVPTGNVTINFAANQTASKTGISSPEGFSISPTINWGTGGSAWFELTTTGDVASGSNKSIGIKIKSGLTGRTTANTKEATVTLTNKIDGAASATFKVSPVWLTPDNGNGQATTINVTVVKKQTGSITIKVPYGGFTATSNSTSVATVSSNSNTGVITVTGVAPGQTTVKVANTQDANKSRSYTVNVTVGGAYTVQNSEKILINGLYWTKGNLVANGTNGCKVGAETAYGLHFRWGSLVGYDANNTATNPAAVVYPDEYTSGAVVFTSSPSNGDPNNAMNLTGGTGDPCKVYLAGNWRLPTDAEFAASFGGKYGVDGEAWDASASTWVTNYNSSGVNGRTFANGAIFFPAAGTRGHSSGSLGNQGASGYFWSSIAYGSGNAWRLYFYSGKASMASSYRVAGYAVRCVQEP